MSVTTDYKQAAIEQWTADPCGSAAGEPGTREYFEALLEMRAAYAPWMDSALDYAGARGLRVLDVGCGQGIDVARYALAGARATGIDLTPRHVELARSHTAALGLEAEILQGDAETLPFPDGTFDRASSNGVLHHTPDMPAALCEIRRVLRPGGRATVIVYNRRSFHYYVEQLLLSGVLQGGLRTEGSMSAVLSRNVEVSSIDARPLVNVYTPAEMRGHLEAAGFSDVGTSVAHFHPSDTFVTALLAAHLSVFRRRRILDTLGRIGGWYVIARGSAS
jgi:ubiquinone/menaquinone biosynthesis C-methylase UbiE